jgi:hypothetical protein
MLAGVDQVAGASAADIALGVVAFWLVIVTIVLATLSARRFTGGIGKGMLVIALGVVVMGLDFLEALNVRVELSLNALQKIPPAAVQEATIIVALVLFSVGFLIMYRTAVKVAKGGTTGL